MRTFTVPFNRLNDDGFWTYDETQFDVRDEGFVFMFNNLVDLFNKFVEENHWDVAYIDQIYEVPYNGEV